MKEITFKGDIQRLVAGPNDRFIITTERVISDETAQHIHQAWKQFNGDEVSRLLVLSDGMQLSVIAEQDAELVELAHKYSEMDEATLTDLLVSNSYELSKTLVEIKKLAAALLPKKG